MADALNQIMNALRARKKSVVLHRYTNLLLSVLALAKLYRYISSYSLEEKKLTITFGKLHGCNAIKPRFIVKRDDYDKYVKRYLPAKDIGILVVSSSSGIMTHHTAEENGKGGCLLAFFF